MPNKYNDFMKNAIYDKSSYYPGSAKEGINIFILNTEFNFKHSEFSNTDENEV